MILGRHRVTVNNNHNAAATTAILPMALLFGWMRSVTMRLFIVLLLSTTLTLPGAVHVVVRAGTGAAAAADTSFFSLGRYTWTTTSQRQRQQSMADTENDHNSWWDVTATEVHESTTGNRRHPRRRSEKTAPYAAAATLTASTTTTTLEDVAVPQKRFGRHGGNELWHQLRRAPVDLQRWLTPPFLRRRRQATTTTTTEAVSSRERQEDDVETMTNYHDLAKPIFSQDTWTQQTGREFLRHTRELVDALADTGRIVLFQQPEDGNPWIDWRLRQSVVDDGHDGHDSDEYDTRITVYTGASRVNGYGSATPWIKTVAVIPHLSPTQLVDLLWDSARVKTYNAWSMGRKDLWTAHDDGGDDGGMTKIVRSRTQPPMGAKPVVATTLLHARPYGDGDDEQRRSWLLVSRAVGGTRFPLDDDDDVGTSEMLLGVNLLEALPHHGGTRLTAITHVYSPSVPSVLAERLGVKSAVRFVRDVRRVKTSP